MPEITIKVDGADAIRERLRELSSRLSNMSPIMRAIGDRVVEQTKRRFEAGGPAPDGAAWLPPKSPNPKRVRTLTVTGHLRDSIRPQVDGRRVVIGTNKVYAAIHQLGGKTAASVIVPRRKLALKTPYGLFKKVNHPGSVIPARPFLGVSAANSEEILDIINDYIASR
jgi:phage virion morphogenesis protein